MRHIKRKIPWGLLVCILLVLIVAVGPTIAYLSDEEEVVNTFTMGKIDIELEEPNWEETAGENLLPGAVVYKDPTVLAMKGACYMRLQLRIVDGSNKPVTDELRIQKILQTIYYDAGYTAKTNNAYANTTLLKTAQYTQAELQALLADEKTAVSRYNHTEFHFAGCEENNPGVLYFNYIGENGIFDAASEQTATLFSHILLPADWDSGAIALLNGDVYAGDGTLVHTGTGYKLVLCAQGIQTDGFASAEEAFGQLNAQLKVDIMDSNLL